MRVVVTTPYTKFNALHTFALPSPSPLVLQAVGGSRVTTASASRLLAEQGELDEPLQFVGRYFEALEVLLPNLRNTAAIDDGDDIKFTTPFATQLPGTGKTALGANLTAILRRPRDTPEDEAAVAEQMKLACRSSPNGVEPGLIDAALQADGDENLVMRMLMSDFPGQVDLLERLKGCEPVIVKVNDIVPPGLFGLTFDTALAYAIFCSSRKLSAVDPAVYAAFKQQQIMSQLAAGAARALVQRSGGAAVLVLDDISALGQPRFAEYFKGASGSTPLHIAMSSLAAWLKLLHGVRGCFVYCTGRLLWLSMTAFAGQTSALFVAPTMLQPLSDRDVLATMRATKAADGSALENSLGVTVKQRRYFAEAAAMLCGGLGRPLQYLLRAQQLIARGAAAAGCPLVLDTPEAVDTALEECVRRIGGIAGLQLSSIKWDGPVDAIESGDLPAWTGQRNHQVQLVQLIARLLLLDATFPSDSAVTLGLDAPARIVDVAMALGVHQVAAAYYIVRLFAGDSLTRSLVNDPKLAAMPGAVTTVRLMDAFRTFGGTMAGRPFELMVAEAINTAHSTQRRLLKQGRPQKRQRKLGRSSSSSSKSPPPPPPVVTLGALLPHCSDSALGAAPIPSLNLMVMPTVAPSGDDDVPLLQPSDKAALCSGSRKQWLLTGGSKPVIHSDDLPWLLSEWLPKGSLAIPASAPSGSQDLFLRVPGGVVGFALKAVREPGTTWSVIEDELAKTPVLPAGTHYLLVLWSLTLSPAVRAALAEAPHAQFGPGRWVVDAVTKTLRLAAAAESKRKPLFTVPAGMELIIANPHSPTGGGLAEVLGFSLLQQVRASRESLDGIHVLDAWMAYEALPRQ